MGKVRVWFDREADFLEVTFADHPGYFREVGPDVYERVDDADHLIGFAVFNFLKHDQEAVELPFDLAVTKSQVSER